MMSAAFAWMDRQCFWVVPQERPISIAETILSLGAFVHPHFVFVGQISTPLGIDTLGDCPSAIHSPEMAGVPVHVWGSPCLFLCGCPTRIGLLCFAGDGMGAPLGYWLGLQDASDCVVQNSVGYGPLSFPCRCRLAVCGASKERDGCDDT